ncbi:hypothetical protein [Fodinicola feengrottensis]|nr:hypothetical protein [Fodinicola feengrottensis]
MPDGDGEPVMDFGLVPIRLNPEPRHIGETRLQIDGQLHDTEVVWCRRIDPARAIIQNVPTPESGHRFGDLVLHDGEPVGSRKIDGQERGVFQEIALLRPSEKPTLRSVVFCPSEADAQQLQSAFEAADLGAEDWTQSVRMLCKSCSEGNPDPSHDHGPVEWDPERDYGIGATFGEADQVLRQWALSGSDRSYSSPERAF